MLRTQKTSPGSHDQEKIVKQSEMRAERASHNLGSGGLALATQSTLQPGVDLNSLPAPNGRF